MVTYSVSLVTGLISDISIDLLLPVFWDRSVVTVCLFPYLLIYFITLDLYNLSDGLPWTILLPVCGEL